jgi:hypothetical protein
MDTWERPPSPPNDPTLSTEELEAVRSKIVISRLIEAEAPPLATQNFASANENSKLTDKSVDHFKQSASSNTRRAGLFSIQDLISLKKGSIAILGTLAFMTVCGFGVVLIFSSHWNLQAWRSTSESLTGSVSNVISARSTSIASSTAPAPIFSAPDLSETTTQLQSLGQELGSLRQDIRSLADGVAEIRKAQADLVASQTQLVHETQRLVSRSHADSIARSTVSEKTSKPLKGQKRLHQGIFPPFF